jgi:hypothetical protein
MSDLHFKVLSGNASSEELSAVIAVLSAVIASTAEQAKPLPEQNWAKPALLMRKPLPNSWAASYLVR